METKLLCGDCATLLSEIPDDSVDAIITDPPYGIDYKSGRQGIDRKTSNVTRVDKIVRESYFDTISNDSELPTDWIHACYDKLKDGGALYIFSHWRTWHQLHPAVEQAGYKVKGMIVLNKSNHGMGDLKGSYAPKHELLLFATKGRHLLNFHNGRISDVWDVPVMFSGKRRLHPNEKPIKWLTVPILHSTNEGDTVLDPFMGSGTTGEACVLTNRNFIGVEIDRDYFDVARDRIDKAVEEASRQPALVAQG